MDDDIAIGNLLKESGLVQSTSEAMRLVKQGAVKINDEKIDDPKFSIEKNQELLIFFDAEFWIINFFIIDFYCSLFN